MHPDVSALSLPQLSSLTCSCSLSPLMSKQTATDQAALSAVSPACPPSRHHPPAAHSRRLQQCCRARHSASQPPILLPLPAPEWIPPLTGPRELPTRNSCYQTVDSPHMLWTQQMCTMTASCIAAQASPGLWAMSAAPHSRSSGSRLMKQPQCLSCWQGQHLLVLTGRYNVTGFQHC